MIVKEDLEELPSHHLLACCAEVFKVPDVLILSRSVHT